MPTSTTPFRRLQQLRQDLAVDNPAFAQMGIGEFGQFLDQATGSDQFSKFTGTTLLGTNLRKVPSAVDALIDKLAPGLVPSTAEFVGDVGERFGVSEELGEQVGGDLPGMMADIAPMIALPAAGAAIGSAVGTPLVGGPIGATVGKVVGTPLSMASAGGRVLAGGGSPLEAFVQAALVPFFPKIAQAGGQVALKRLGLGLAPGAITSAPAKAVTKQSSLIRQTLKDVGERSLFAQRDATLDSLKKAATGQLFNPTERIIARGIGEHVVDVAGGEIAANITAETAMGIAGLLSGRPFGEVVPQNMEQLRDRLFAESVANIPFLALDVGQRIQRPPDLPKGVRARDVETTPLEMQDRKMQFPVENAEGVVEWRTPGEFAPYTTADRALKALQHYDKVAQRDKAHLEYEVPPGQEMPASIEALRRARTQRLKQLKTEFGKKKTRTEAQQAEYSRLESEINSGFDASVESLDRAGKLLPSTEGVKIDSLVEMALQLAGDDPFTRTLVSDKSSMSIAELSAKASEIASRPLIELDEMQLSLVQAELMRAKVTGEEPRPYNDVIDLVRGRAQREVDEGYSIDETLERMTRADLSRTERLATAESRFEEIQSRVQEIKEAKADPRKSQADIARMEAELDKLYERIGTQQKQEKVRNVKQTQKFVDQFAKLFGQAVEESGTKLDLDLTRAKELVEGEVRLRGMRGGEYRVSGDLEQQYRQGLLSESQYAIEKGWKLFGLDWRMGPRNKWGNQGNVLIAAPDEAAARARFKEDFADRIRTREFSKLPETEFVGRRVPLRVHKVTERLQGMVKLRGMRGGEFEPSSAERRIDDFWSEASEATFRIVETIDKHVRQFLEVPEKTVSPEEWLRRYANMDPEQLAWRSLEAERMEARDAQLQDQALEFGIMSNTPGDIKRQTRHMVKGELGLYKRAKDVLNPAEFDKAVDLLTANVLKERAGDITNLEKGFEAALSGFTFGLKGGKFKTPKSLQGLVERLWPNREQSLRALLEESGFNRDEVDTFLPELLRIERQFPSDAEVIIGRLIEDPNTPMGEFGLATGSGERVRAIFLSADANNMSKPDRVKLLSATLAHELNGHIMQQLARQGKLPPKHAQRWKNFDRAVVEMGEQARLAYLNEMFRQLPGRVQRALRPIIGEMRRTANDPVEAEANMMMLLSMEQAYGTRKGFRDFLVSLPTEIYQWFRSVIEYGRRLSGTMFGHKFLRGDYDEGPFYHGTDIKLSQLKGNRLRPTQYDGNLGKGVYFVSRNDTAREFAILEKGVAKGKEEVIPARVRGPLKTITRTEWKKLRSNIEFTEVGSGIRTPDFEAFRQQAIADGFKGLKMTGQTGGDEIVVFSGRDVEPLNQIKGRQKSLSQLREFRDMYQEIMRTGNALDEELMPIRRMEMLEPEGLMEMRETQLPRVYMEELTRVADSELATSAGNLMRSLGHSETVVPDGTTPDGPVRDFWEGFGKVFMNATQKAKMYQTPIASQLVHNSITIAGRGNAYLARTMVPFTGEVNAETGAIRANTRLMKLEDKLMRKNGKTSALVDKFSMRQQEEIRRAEKAGEAAKEITRDDPEIKAYIQADVDSGRVTPEEAEQVWDIWQRMAESSLSNQNMQVEGAIEFGRLMMGTKLGAENTAHNKATEPERHFNLTQDQILRFNDGIMEMIELSVVPGFEAASKAAAIHEGLLKMVKGNENIVKRMMEDGIATRQYVEALNKLYQGRRGFVSESRNLQEGFIVKAFHPKLKGDDGNHRGFAKTIEEARAQRDKLRSEGWKVHEIVKTEPTSQSDGSSFMQEGLLDQVRQIDSTYLEALKLSDLDVAAKEQVAGFLNTADHLRRGFQAQKMSAQGSRRKLIKGRETVPMFDNHIRYLQASAYATAAKLREAQYQMFKASPDYQANPKAAKFMDDFMLQMSKPSFKLAQNMAKFNFTWFMGMNLSSHILESFQTFFSTMPLLMEEGAGIMQSSEITAKAAKTMTDFLRRTASKRFSGSELSAWKDPKNAERMQWMQQQGRMSLGWASDSAHSATLDFAHGRMVGLGNLEAFDIGTSAKQILKSPLGVFADMSSRFYSNFTHFNARMSTLMAFDFYENHWHKLPSSDGLKREPMTESEIRSKVLEFVDISTMFGGRANRPVGMHKIFGDFIPQAFLLPLQGYTMGMMGMMARNAKLGLVPDKYLHDTKLSRTDKANHRRALMMMLGVQTLASGAIGLPFAGAALALMEEIFDDKEVRKGLRSGLQDTLTKMAADDEDTGRVLTDMAMEGVVNTLLSKSYVPADIGSRFAIGGLMGTDQYKGYDPMKLFGPTASIVQAFIEGGGYIKKGEFEKAMPHIVPQFLKRPMQLLRDDGDFRNKEGTLKAPLDNKDRFAMLLGFTPSKVRTLREIESLQRSAARAEDSRRGQFLRELSQGVLDGKPGEVSTAIRRQRMLEGMEFNEAATQRAVAEGVERRVFAEPPLRSGTRGTMGSDREILEMFDPEHIPADTSEVQRLQLRQSVLGQLGYAGRPSPTAFKRAVLIDQILQSSPHPISRAEAAVRADLMLSRGRR